MNGDADHEQVIAGLAEQLRVPFHKVSEVYWDQLQRLAAGARIPNFLSVLATGKTRSILRGTIARDS